MKKEPSQRKDGLSSKIILFLSLSLTLICVIMVTYVLNNHSNGAPVSKTVIFNVPNDKERISITKTNEELVSIVETHEEKEIEIESEEEDAFPEFSRHGRLSHFYNAWNDHTSRLDLNKIKIILDRKLEKTGLDRATFTIAITDEMVIRMVALRGSRGHRCQRHPVSFQYTVLKGRFMLKTHDIVKPIFSYPGDQVFIPKWQPHIEAGATEGVTYLINVITPNVDPDTLTEYLSAGECSHKAIPPLHIPKIVTDEEPVRKPLPESWTAFALLHPFAEAQGDGAEKDFPFSKIGHAKISYDVHRALMNVLLINCEKQSWWFQISGNSNLTRMSRNGTDWTDVDLGWSLPSRDWIGPQEEYVGHSPMNWMSNEVDVDWWKKNNKNTSTWKWFDRKNNGLPFRLLFSAPPPSNVKGDPENLALFQMFSLSYIATFEDHFTEIEDLHLNGIPITGFKCGNLHDWPMFDWTHHFSMSALKIPVEYSHNPYPAKVYYHWKNDANYTGNPFDRSKSTIFYNDYNQADRLETIRSDVFGHWDGIEKRDGVAYLTKTSIDSWKTSCEKMLDGDQPMSQHPPWWPQLGQAKIMGIIEFPTNDTASTWVSPLTGSNRKVAIVHLTFSPHLPNFPNSTSLWTWYDYEDFLQGGNARPVFFMHSLPQANMEMSLSHADFFDFNVMSSDLHSRTQLDYENLQQHCNFT
ncbi:uncharacterized protein [Clytia hemisphaerica]|uniref:Uncharacterized protein n=1 Tax=Clytia hemisphaerica TaxID=252671 RepID=A0A7M5VB39_9CNID